VSAAISASKFRAKNPRFRERPHIPASPLRLIVAPNLGHAFRTSQLKRKNFMATRSTSDIEESTEKLLQDLKEVVRDGEELLRAGADELGERGAAAREKLTAALEMAKETQRRLQEKVVASAKATDNYIRTNPYQSIGIAFGVGLLLGVYAARPRR
jgi:ElaB/YqjD/DUF883 family membrane-anchored ribosome-binding protein